MALRGQSKMSMGGAVDMVVPISSIGKSRESCGREVKSRTLNLTKIVIIISFREPYP